MLILSNTNHNSHPLEKTLTNDQKLEHDKRKKRKKKRKKKMKQQSKRGDKHKSKMKETGSPVDPGLPVAERKKK
jgi:hypothetical protein